MEYRSSLHHHGSNLAQYRYVQKKYGKKTRAQVFWATTGLIVLLVGGPFVLQISETDAEREARRTSLEKDYLDMICKQDQGACDEIRERIRKQHCLFFQEDCGSKK